jgi:hypothetical protein
MYYIKIENIDIFNVYLYYYIRVHHKYSHAERAINDDAPCLRWQV